MAMSDWSTTASSNGTTLGINIAENCPAANINNAMREMMAELRAAVTTATLTSEGNASVGGAFSVTGNATFSGSLGAASITLSGALSATNGTFSGNGSFGGTLAATGNTTLGGTLAVSGAATLSSTLSVAGATAMGALVTTGLGVSTAAAIFEHGGGRTGSGDVHFDLHATSSSDYEARFIRSSGANGNLSFINTGTGTLYIQQTGSAAIDFQTNSASRFTIAADGSALAKGTLASVGAIYPSNDSAFNLSYSGGFTTIAHDTGDYQQYDRSGNVYTWYIGSGLKLYVNSSGLFDGSNNKYWNAGNDGSGSGLDADLLDGHDSSEFVRVTSSSIVQNGGYRVYSDGLIETWGFISIGQDSTGTYNLPVAHTSWVVPVISAYWPSDQTDSAHAVDWSSTNGTPPTSISFRNADDRTVTVWIQTKGK